MANERTHSYLANMTWRISVFQLPLEVQTLTACQIYKLSEGNLSKSTPLDLQPCFADTTHPSDFTNAIILVALLKSALGPYALTPGDKIPRTLGLSQKAQQPIWDDGYALH